MTTNNYLTPIPDSTLNGANTIDQAMDIVHQVMYDIVDSEVPVLGDASRHILDAGGKRIRPRLLISSYLACGGDDFEYAAPVAAALELVHTASIVHDDINDHGILRRGRPSINAIWGRTFALLTGDFLFTKVYDLMAPYGDLNVLFAEATTALIEGETLQAYAVKEKNFSSEIYMRIIALKTAALFKVGAMLGGKLAGASSRKVDALSTYGYNVGLAFQIVDDILDLVGDEEQLGKTAGIDLEQGKGFASIGNAPDPSLEIKQKLLSGGRLKEARKQARFLVESAVESLSPLPETPYKGEMIALANLVVERDF